MEVTFNRSGRVVHLPEEVSAWTRAFTSKMMDEGQLTYLAATLVAHAWSARDIVVEIGAYHGSTSVFMTKVLQRLGHRVPVLSIDAFDRAPRFDDAAPPGRLRRWGDWVTSHFREPPAWDPLRPQGAYAAYIETIREHGVEDVCLPLAAFSQDAARVVAEPVGVLLVDGGHEYPVVSQDLALYAPKVPPGGFIFVDDYEAYPGVGRAVDEYFVDTRPFTIVHRSYFVVAERSRAGA
jgi:hypothetical protein